MDFALAPEDEAFRDELRAWLDENLPPFLEAESLGDDASLSGEASQKRRQKWQRTLNEGGWAAIHWGPEYGGRTINAMQRLIYSEVMAEYRTPGMFNTNGIWQIGPMIIAWGTEEQKARWLPSILDAEEHWCQGFSEPEAGNDLANLRTTAIRESDAEDADYIVNGSKIWISSAHLATWGLFLLRTDPSAIERGKKHEGITAFILNLHTPGIEVRPIKDMAGEELFNEIFFTDVRIPADCRLGSEGEGWMVAMGTLGYERVGIASQISILSADLRAMVEAARSVNPGALEDPALRDRIAKVWTEIEFARLLSLRALSKIMKGEKNWPEVPFAKLSWSSMAQTLAELAVDLLGPAGILARGGPDSVDRGKWTRLYAFQRYSTIGGGSTEIQKNIIADRAIAMPGKSRADRTLPVSTDPRSPCLIGVARRTWHGAPDTADGAPEPLDMWEEVARAAAADAGAPDAVRRIQRVDVVYSQSWQYDDPARLAERLGATPAQSNYSGIGGSVPQSLASSNAVRITEDGLDLALIVGAEALATVRRLKKAGAKPQWSFRPAERRPFPMDMEFHPSEISHAVFEAYLTFALFDNARRAHLGRTLTGHRERLGHVMAPMTEVAAASPYAWFRVARTADEIVGVTRDNRMVAYPYTKLMTAIMDVDMAAGLLMASAAAADELGVPEEKRVYLRGWGYDEDPAHVADHPELWRSPAMARASAAALAGAGIGIDEVAHLDLYSCFASSICFALDALGLAEDDPRGVTQTGGLPYHGGPGSNYMTHSIAAMAETLRGDPGSFGLVSGVGMHMQKHAYGLWSTTPGAVNQPAPRQSGPAPATRISDDPEGPARVATYSVLHGRDGEPESALLVCDLPDGGRCYAKLDGGEGLLQRAETEELIGRRVELTPKDGINLAH